jgi:acyl carrier protein
MNKEEIKDKIKGIIVDKNGVEPEQVTDNASFETDLGMDSLDRVELLMEIEKEFKITIPDDEAEKAHTLNDCVEIVERAQHGSKS